MAKKAEKKKKGSIKRHKTKKVLSQDSLFALKVLRVFDFDSLLIYNKKIMYEFCRQEPDEKFCS